ncbi:MAG: heparan-alpha-glucosaminide N-acetyltransferase domain-containing protein [bacterium]
MNSKAPGVNRQEHKLTDPKKETAAKFVLTATAEQTKITRINKAKRDKPDARRLVSIDAFRGFTILAMLVVNNKVPGVPTPDHLTHASWSEGLHFADLIFPWFIFIVGVVVPYSGKAGAAWRHYAGILKRAVVLVLLGCLINSSYAGKPLFDFGVLQLIGISYFFAALAGGMRPGWRIGIAFALLVSHWAAVRFMPIPGVGAGVFTEKLNLIRYANKNYFEAYGLQGILSVGPAAALALIGTIFGDYMKRAEIAPERKWKGLMAGGVALAAAGLLWNLDVPFRKSLWTASYAVFASGTGAFLLGLFYWAIDIRGLRKWAFPLLVMGTNALVVFVGPVLINIHILREWTW